MGRRHPCLLFVSALESAMHLLYNSVTRVEWLVDPAWPLIAITPPSWGYPGGVMAPYQVGPRLTC